MKPSFMIAAPTSGSGKTTIARGLMALFTKKGFRVQPFKCGPDYIDPKFHTAVCHRPSINLDTFMATPTHVKELLSHYGQDADICIIEGMMGLFDGYDRDRGSSYEIARLLQLPVVLVVDAKSAAYSTAALISGFLHFKEDVNIAGVIFNKVASERHFQMLQQLCEDLHTRCYGYLPKTAVLEQGTRYLGLDFSKLPENGQLVTLLEKHIDWKRLSLLTTPLLNTSGLSATHHPSPVITKTACIARNAESFSFIYDETLDLYENAFFFDPETEVPGLEAIDMLYLPGGYPEKHLEALTANQAARTAIKAFAERGGRIIAECGGMMYLCEKIVTDDGEYPMCGVLPYTVSARTADRKLSLGYRQFTLDGMTFRGHEFHYTQFTSQPPSATQVYNAKGEPVTTPVFRYKNVLASYTHFYGYGILHHRANR